MVHGILRELADSGTDTLRALGRYAMFAGRLAAETPRALLRFRLVVEQVHNAGALSLSSDPLLQAHHTVPSPGLGACADIVS